MAAQDRDFLATRGVPDARSFVVRAVTMRDPSGLKAPEFTGLSWPRRTAISLALASASAAALAFSAPGASGCTTVEVTPAGVVVRYSQMPPTMSSSATTAAPAAAAPRHWYSLSFFAAHAATFSSLRRSLSRRRFSASASSKRRLVWASSRRRSSSPRCRASSWSFSCRRRSSSAARRASASWRSCGDNHGCCNALQIFAQNFSTRSATSVEDASRCRKSCHCSYWRLPIIANNGSWRHRSPVSAGTGM